MSQGAWKGEVSRDGRPRNASDAPSSPQRDGVLNLHYSRELDALSWEAQWSQGMVPDRWPYGLHRLEEQFELQVSPPRQSKLFRALRAVAGGYDWHRAAVSTDGANVCWDERAGVPVALSGSPTLTGVIWLTEREHRHWTDQLVRRALARASTFVLSSLQLEDLRKRWAVPRSRSHYVPFGIDEDFWHPTTGDNDGVLIVGNDRHRDHLTAIRAAQRTRKRSTLVTAQAVEAPRIPRMSHRELRQAYADHAVVALATIPNRHASGVTVALEAMACGRPVVATRGGGLEEYITPDVGVLVPPGDDAAMATELTALLNDPDRAEEMGGAGRAAVEAIYNTTVMAGSLLELVRAL